MRILSLLLSLGFITAPLSAAAPAKSKAAKAPQPAAYAASVPKPTLAEVRYGAHERHVLDFWKAESAAPTPLVFVRVAKRNASTASSTSPSCCGPESQSSPSTTGSSGTPRPRASRRR